MSERLKNPVVKTGDLLKALERAGDDNDALRARVAKLEGHIAHADAYHAAMEKAEAERDALRARVAKLEAALREARAVNAEMAAEIERRDQ